MEDNSGFARALTMLAARTEQMRWRPIETAPKDGRLVLLAINPPLNSNNILGWWQEDVLPVVMGRWNDDTWAVDMSKWDSVFMEEGAADSEGRSFALCLRVRPTHWMPLPPPPASE